MQPLGERLELRGTLLLAGLVVGCAHAKVPPPVRVDPELGQLRAQLAERERTIRDLEGRLALVTAARPAAIEPPAAPARACSPEPSQPPRDTREAPDVEREGPRPMLRLYAQASPSATTSRSTWAPPASGDRLAVVPLPSATSAAAPPDADAADLYVRAIDLVRRREFPEALRELDAFLHRFADDPRAPRALFWRGEVRFAQRDYAGALASYEAALARAPSGDRAADALLRIARCCLRLGAAERARATLAQLEAEFPDSEAARLVKQGAQEDG
jgi:tol-pal system protein YbgF